MNLGLPPKKLKYSNEDKVKKKKFAEIFMLHFVLNSYQTKFVNFFCFCKFVSKVIIFQEALQFKEIIILFYNLQNNMKMIGKVPPLLTWHIFQIIVDSIGPIVFVYILNQYKGCWF